MLTLIQGPNPWLEQICRSDAIIPSDLIPEMFRLLQERNGLGLAAPQVGFNARLFITHWGEVFISPILTWKNPATVRVEEGCLSFPNLSAFKTRHIGIEVGGRYYDDLRQAIIIQHELDHLNGVTIAT